MSCHNFEFCLTKSGSIYPLDILNFNPLSDNYPAASFLLATLGRIMPYLHTNLQLSPHNLYLELANKVYSQHLATQYDLVIIIYVKSNEVFKYRREALKKEVIIMNIIGIAILILAVCVVYFLITHTSGGHTENRGHGSF